MFVRQILLLAGALGLAACTETSGPEPLAPGFAGTLNGVPWTADTSVSAAFATTDDTTLFTSGVRQISADSGQEITLVLHRLSAEQFALTDSVGEGYGELVYFHDHSALPGSQLVLRSLAGRPGSIRISEVNETDSTVAGTFAFEAAADPDTIPHQFLAGHFKVRYSLQTVYASAPRE
jgi:hypothetical protein